MQQKKNNSPWRRKLLAVTFCEMTHEMLDAVLVHDACGKKKKSITYLEVVLQGNKYSCQYSHHVCLQPVCEVPGNRKGLPFTSFPRSDFQACTKNMQFGKMSTL